MGLNHFFSNGTDILETHPKRKTKCYPPKRRRKSCSARKEKKKEETTTPKVNRLADILPNQRQAILSNLLEVKEGDLQNLTQEDLTEAVKPLPFVYGVSSKVDKIDLEKSDFPAVIAFIEKTKHPTIICLSEAMQCLV